MLATYDRDDMHAADVAFSTVKAAVAVVFGSVFSGVVVSNAAVSNAVVFDVQSTRQDQLHQGYSAIDE